MSGCITLPKKTLITITGSGNDFLIQVKANTSKLYKQVQDISKTNTVLGTHFTSERASGRIDNRSYEVFDVESGQITGGWEGIERVIKVRRWDALGTPEKTKKRRNKKTKKKKKDTNGYYYYILSKPINDTTFLGQMIRNHWTIENNLHWVKDKHLKEDDMTIKDKYTAPLIASLNNIAINQIRKAGHKTNCKFFEDIRNMIDELIKIIRT